MGSRHLSLVLFVAGCSSQPAPPSATPATPSREPVVTVPVTAAPAPTPTPARPPTGPASGVPVENVTLAEVGLEATSLDRSVDPCVDFYQFACGGWLRANPIPSDRPSWSRFDEIVERNNKTLLAILDEASRRTGDKLGDYFASCMDEPAIEKAGTGAIKGLLNKTLGVKDPKSWVAALTALHQAGIWVVWNTTADADLADASRYVTWLDPAGLGLPDRDYYVKPELADKLAAYTQHVGRLLGLAGVAKAESAAADVIAIETAIAKLMKTATEKRDMVGLNNPTDLKGLGKQAKSIDWKAYFKTFGISPARLLDTTPAFFSALDGLRKQFKPAQWASYFTYHLVRNSAFALPKAFDDEVFALRRTVMGMPEQLPRNKRCIDSTAQGLGELLGKQYVEKALPPSAKQAATTMFAAVANAMREELAKVEWMSEPTRKVALDKLSKLVPMIGYPDAWRSYDFAVKRDDFAGNLLRARAFETRRKLAKSGQPYDRGEWLENTFDVDAYYNSSANNSALLAGILQAPFFGPDRSVAANLGGIGMVIGHELTHGFDDQGAQFDAAGNLKDWWAKDDKTRFAERGRCVAEQYGTFEAAPKQFVNGDLTVGENIADLGGVKMAFRAYRAQRANADKVFVADGFSEDQQFFLSFGQVWCAKFRPEAQQMRLTIDSHSPPKFRVYGGLRNFPEFAEAFSCAAGTPMRPAKACSVW